jgi:hypothetical protein
MNTESRRGDYRHELFPGQKVPVWLETLSPRSRFDGEIIDLSVRGVRVHLCQDRVPLRLGDICYTELNLPRVQEKLALHATVRYLVTFEGGLRLGLRFLPSINPATQQARQKLLWRFLMDEQRREHRGLRLDA